MSVTLTKLGSFRVPQGGTSPANLGYSYARIGFRPPYSGQPNGTLFIVGHEQSQVVAEITIPSLGTGAASGLPMASFIQNPRSISHNSNGNLAGTVKVGGLHFKDGRLIDTQFEFYDAEGNASVAIGRLPGAALSQKGEGLYGTTGAPGNGFVAGYMCDVPAAHQASIGKPMVIGQGILSIISRTSSGPALFAIDHADFGVKNPVPVTPLLYYPLSNPLSNPDVANPLYTRADFIGGVFFAGDKVCFVGSHGTGTPRYGDGSTSGDPARSWKGEHAYPYTYQVWEYELADLLAVKNGTKNPWDPRPVVWSLDPWMYSNSAKYAGGVTYDAATNRLFIAQPEATSNGYDPFPVIHVFSINGATTPPADTTAPSIANILAIPGETSCSVSWTTDEASDTRVEYTETDFPGVVAINSTPVTAHSIELTGLKYSMTYTFRVKSRDAAGNAAISNAATFTTLDPPPSPCAELEGQVVSMAAQINMLQLQVTSLQLELSNKNAQLLQANTDLSNALSEVSRVNALLSASLAETNSWHAAYDTLNDSVIAATAKIRETLALLE